MGGERLTACAMEPPLNFYINDRFHWYLINSEKYSFIGYNMKFVSYPRNADPGVLGVIILSSGSEVRGFDPGRGRWIFSERKNSEYDFLRKGSKAVGPVS